MTQIVVAGDDLLVYPSFGRLPEMKTLGATWDARRVCWKLPALDMNVACLIEMFPSVSMPVLPRPVTKIIDDSRLFPYQIEQAGRLAAARRGELLVMSPGLGKTAVAIAAADVVVPDDQVIVVAPASLLRTWEKQIKQWGHGDTSTARVVGKPDWDVVSKARWLVTSWDTFARHADWFAGKWPLLILDESVLAKSRASKRFKSMDKFRRSVSRVWLLSGSPTTRYVDDLWAQLHVIWPLAFRSYWRFAERYGVVEKSVWAKTVTATRGGRDAVKDNSDLISVVNQEDVLDLPEYLFEVVDVELEGRQKTAYQSMLKEFVALLPDGDEIVAESVIGQLTRLQQITSYWDGQSAKHDALVEMLRDGTYERPALIWTHWSDGAKALTLRLESEGFAVGHAHGDLSPKVKEAVIESFIDGTIDVLVLALGVGKFGFTFTHARTIAYVDKTTNADDYFQSLRRVRRIGLKHHPVVVTFRAADTTDDRLIEPNLEGKVVDIARITGSRLRELLLGLGHD